jgi:hypothetical protein
MTTDFEKLGVFYLGKQYDLAARTRREGLVLYDSKDLVTHAVCVGMTGSGKTGLCIGLLEEAAIDGIPAIIIDPKGDLANMLLTFPDLKGEDFRPWINEEDARKKGLDPDAFAEQQAATWTKGLAEWGQSGERIRKLKSLAEFTVYTPGSTAGVGVSVLRSFAAPSRELIEDGEMFRDRVSSTAASLLGLMGVEGDQVASREHTLISTILSTAWSAGKDVDLPAMIQQIQSPPFARIGVMELESVFPAKDRFSLAMMLNNLVASPGFSSWLEGEPMDVQSFLFTPQGKPRHAIFSIAHLSDTERMFFVSLLLNHVLSWTRAQSGTTSLRAIVYMDEIAGYFPPTANPPSKKPLLTLMKQGRAFGVGVMLATQNPVDLDYKGLSNAGTWFIGRLQTDRDKQRVLDGLEGAAANASGGFDRATMDGMLSQLGQRVFLMNNVHDDHPEVFETRWCLSYLRGPMTRTQIKALSGTPASAKRTEAGASNAPIRRASNIGVAPGSPTSRPVLDPAIPQYFVPSRSSGTIEYTPKLLGFAKVYYYDAKAGIDQEIEESFVTDISTGPVAVDWERAEQVELTEADVEREPAPSASFGPLHADAGKPRSFDAWKKALADSLYRTHELSLMHCAAYKMSSKPCEPEREFKARVSQASREARDEAVDKLRTKYAPKVATLQDRIRRAQQQAEVQKEQASAAKTGTFLSIGTAILGAFMGRKAISSGNLGRASTAARGVSRQMKESSDIARAEENVAALEDQLRTLEAEFRSETDELSERFDASSAQFTTLKLHPKKAGINVRAVVLAWMPASFTS